MPGMSGRSCMSQRRRRSATASRAGTLTYGDAAADVDAVAARYQAAGYGVGHRVGLMLENRPAAFLHWFALNRLGASVVPLNSDLRPAELAYLVQHSGICLAVGAQAMCTRCAAQHAMRSDHATVARIPARACPHATQRRGHRHGMRPALHLRHHRQAEGLRAVQRLLPALRPLVHRIGGLCALRPGEDRLITPLPMTHVNAMAYSTLAMVMTGGCIIPLDRFHPRSWWQTVRDSKATIMHSLGVMPTHAAGSRSVAGRPCASRAVRLRTRRRSALPRSRSSSASASR